MYRWLDSWIVSQARLSPRLATSCTTITNVAYSRDLLWPPLQSCVPLCQSSLLWLAFSHSVSRHKQHALVELNYPAEWFIQSCYSHNGGLVTQSRNNLMLWLYSLVTRPSHRPVLDHCRFCIWQAIENWTVGKAWERGYCTIIFIAVSLNLNGSHSGRIGVEPRRHSIWSRDLTWAFTLFQLVKKGTVWWLHS